MFPFKESVAILYKAIMTLALAVRGGATGLDPTTSHISLLSVVCDKDSKREQKHFFRLCDYYICIKQHVDSEIFEKRTSPRDYRPGWGTEKQGENSLSRD